MSTVKKIIAAIRSRGVKRTVTVFPKGTIVHYRGVPCELLEDAMYYSETIQPKATLKSAGGK